MNKISLLLGFSFAILTARVPDRWGWEVHRFINYHAVERLRTEMNFWNEQQTFLREHAVDPDQDNNPGYYHYIDIDYYQEFFDGTLPHAWDDIVNLYGENVVIGNGTVPWVIADWTDSLTALMAAGDWNGAWQIAAELGHYVADAHQPLHLTMNYNGQFTGNDGIHSRYESGLVTDHLSELALPDDTGQNWDSPLDSVFSRIDEIYPFVADILAADDYASGQDPGYGYTYNTLMWAELDSLTEVVIDKAIMDLASLWTTAWIRAGQPTPPAVTISPEFTPLIFALDPAYPNPLNPATTIRYTLPAESFTQLVIYDLSGGVVRTLVNQAESPGQKALRWDGRNNAGVPVASGVYLYSLTASSLHSNQRFTARRKLVLVK
ncbi:MAG: T9SS C-terminal target domain-containing protein [Candidatus Neomarinimicrobiota bacterium]|nr:MAG: T9SS C-terminal target domain-containing protein [Candidatus Neomarinimicrobiota bacterium]